MSHYDDYPNRGKPKPEVTYSDHHKLVLQAIYWHHRKGYVCTDQSIFNAIVKARGKVISESGARTRRHELEGAFKLVRLQPHVKGRTESGKACSTYRLTDKGIEKARAELEASRQMKLKLDRIAA